MSETLFNFVLTRPARDPPTRKPVSLLQNSKFQGALLQASKQPNAYDAMLTVARDYVKSSDFVGTETAIPLASQANTFSSALSGLESKANLALGDYAKAIESAFGKEIGALVSSPDYTTSVSRLKDSILAIKQVQEEHNRPLQALTQQLRDLTFIAELPATTKSDCSDVTTPPKQDITPFPHTGASLAAYRRRPLVVNLPVLKSILSTSQFTLNAQKAANEAVLARASQISTLVTQFKQYDTAKRELLQFSAEHFETSPQVDVPASNAPTNLRAIDLLGRKADFLSKLVNPITSPPKLQLAEQGADSQTTPKAIDLTSTDTTTSDDKFLASNLFLPSAPAIKISTTPKMMLTKTALALLSDTTNGILKNEKVSLDTSPLNRALKRVDRQLLSMTNQLNDLSMQDKMQMVSLKTIGSTLLTIRTPAPIPASQILLGRGVLRPPFYIPLDAGNFPHTRGNVSPVGVADLLVVKQQLKAYEAVDVAQIENVLRGEKFDRENTVTTTTSTTTTTATDVTSTSSQEIESTSRFEMSKEASAQIKQDSSLKGGLSISASYGPFVSLTASLEGATSRSQEQATKSATKFAQDVTQKSTKSITQRTTQTVTVVTTNEIIDKMSHGIDNTGAQTNISGVYQWVNKVYEAQIFNYGLRTMYDFMIPEPALFLIEVAKQAHTQAVTIEKPPPFTVQPSDITEYSYPYFASLYKATNLTPPPAPTMNFSKEMSAPYNGDPKVDTNKTDEISIDEGYEAVNCGVYYTWNVWDDQAKIDVIVGNNAFNVTTTGNSGVSGFVFTENRTVPLAVNTFHVSQYTVTIEVWCIRTDRALDVWRMDTWGKLSDAAKAQQQAYDEKLAQLELNAGVAIAGKNPTSNLAAMRKEIKKNCIEILTDQHFDLFGAVDSLSTGLPQIDIAKNDMQGPYVRFFEEAFEWEEMTWITYPYFWGNKSNWTERVSFDDPDPTFADFLQAGYCRAVLPARENFEGAIDHFLKYGEIWMGGPLPIISDPTYLPIAEEIAERSGRSIGEVPQGDPWKVTVPTALVKLRKDDNLPTWQKQSDGTWTPSN